MCYGCRFFFITYEQGRPYGCRAYGFKSRTIPSSCVKRSSGKECMLFERDSKERGERP